VPPVTRAGSRARAFTSAVTWWRPDTAEPDHGALVSDLRPGHELAFLDGDAHKDLVTGANVPVSSPGWLTPPAREARRLCIRTCLPVRRLRP